MGKGLHGNLAIIRSSVDFFPARVEEGPAVRLRLPQSLHPHDITGNGCHGYLSSHLLSWRLPLPGSGLFLSSPLPSSWHENINIKKTWRLSHGALKGAAVASSSRRQEFSPLKLEFESGVTKPDTFGDESESPGVCLADRDIFLFDVIFLLAGTHGKGVGGGGAVGEGCRRKRPPPTPKEGPSS